MARKKLEPQPYAKPDQLQIRGNEIFSPLRQKWVLLTPEEMVRQQYLKVLLEEYGFTHDHLAEEMEVTGRGSAQARADFIIWRTPQDKAAQNSPLIIVECKAEKIPFPPLSIQNKIVATWEAAQKAAAETAAKIEQLERDIEAHLLNAVGFHVEAPSVGRRTLVVQWSYVKRWDLIYNRQANLTLERSLNAVSAVPLGEALKFVSRRWRKSDFLEGTFRYVEISNVTKEEGINGCRVVSVDDPPSRATTLIRAGELILGMTRPYLGAFALVPAEYERCICSSGFALCASVARSDLMLEYALEFLKSSVGLRQMERRMTGGLYPAITQDQLEQVLLPIPPLPVQRQIVERVTKRREEIAKLKAEAKARAEAAKADGEAMILGAKKV